MKDFESIFTSKIEKAFNEYKQLCLSIAEETKKRANNSDIEEEKRQALVYQKESLEKALNDYNNVLKSLHHEFMQAYEKASSELDSYRANGLESILNKI